MPGKDGRPRPAAFGAGPGQPVDGRQEWPAGAPRVPPAQQPPGQWALAQWAPGQRPPAQRLSAQRPAEPGELPQAAGWLDDGQLPQGIWDDDPQSPCAQGSGARSDPKVAGAPAGPGPRSDGRFAAEWSPKGVTVRRNSLLRRRRRAGGGAMVRKAAPEDGLRPVEFAADEFAVEWPVSEGPISDRRVPDGTRPDRTGLGETGSGRTRPPGSARQRSERWNGAGGRWLVWMMRAVIWAVLIVIGFRGVASIVTSVGQTGSSTGAGAARGRFPTALAEAFVLQFGDVYLNFSPASAAQRAAELTPFIPVGSDPQFGWNGTGSQQLQSEEVASVSVLSAHQATVTLLARVNSGLIELGVPVYSAKGGLVVSAEPALLPAPGRVSPPPAPTARSDPTVKAALASHLPAFFTAYASGDPETLAKFLAPGAVVTGLGGAVTFGSVAAIEVPAGGATRRIAVSVVWQLPALATPVQQPAPGSRRQSGDTSQAAATPPVPPGLQMTYDMTIVRQHGAWYVKAIGPSAQQGGS
jgi:Conjugative transposon protein TcpC